MKPQEAKTRRAHEIFSPLGVRSYYTRRQIQNMWRGRKIRFFFAWDSRQVFMAAPPRDEGRIFEPIKTMKELMDRSLKEP